MTKKIISVGALEAEGLRGICREGVLKMYSGSLVVLKSIRRNNLCYLMGNAVTDLTFLGQLDGDFTRLWHSGFGQIGLKSDQALGGASTCHLEAHDSSVLDKKR